MLPKYKCDGGRKISERAPSNPPNHKTTTAPVIPPPIKVRNQPLPGKTKLIYLYVFHEDNF